VSPDPYSAELTGRVRHSSTRPRVPISAPYPLLGRFLRMITSFIIREISVVRSSSQPLRPEFGNVIGSEAADRLPSPDVRFRLTDPRPLPFRFRPAPAATSPWLPVQWVLPFDKLMSTNRPSYRPRRACAISVVPSCGGLRYLTCSMNARSLANTCSLWGQRKIPGVVMAKRSRTARN
jgi:hypothetical protein